MPSKRNTLMCIATLAISLFLAAALCGCGGTNAPVQVTSQTLGLAPAAPVKAGGSDISSWFFQRNGLPKLVLTIRGKFDAGTVADKFSGMQIDPSRIELAKSVRARVYFLGECATLADALCVNTDGLDNKGGAPKVVFPLANSPVKLDDSLRFVDQGTMRVDPAKMGARTPGSPVAPGDFVDIGKIAAGKKLNFFLAADDRAGTVNVYTVSPSANPDGTPHALAFAVPDSPYVLICFEDTFNGGNKDYSDCIVAVDISTYNVEALTGKLNPWGRFRNALMAGALLVVLVFFPVLFWFTQRFYKAKRFNRTREEALLLVKNNDAERALRMVRAAKKGDRNRERRRILTEIEVAALEHLRDWESLRAVYKEAPEAFQEREPGSLILCRMLLEADRLDEAQALRESWRGREQEESEWMNLEVDLLLKRDDRRSALRLLQTKDFYGSQDSGRLARVGMILSRKNPEKAKAYLQRARRLDNRGADVHVCEARACEYQEDVNGALASYKAAVVCRPFDPFIRDYLAEFQRRIGRPRDALQTWAEGMKPPSMDFIWLKVLFWSRVAVPFPASWKSLEPPACDMEPLIRFMVQLPPGQFWDPAAFEPLQRVQPELSSRQEVFWLSILHALRHSHEDEALSLLNMHHFDERSWHEDLEIALQRVLTFRRLGFMDPSLVRKPSKRPQLMKRHPLFITLDRWTSGELEDGPPGLKVLLRSEDAYAAAFLAAGWFEAGLALRTTSALLSGMPDWLTRDIIEAQRALRDGEPDVAKANLVFD